MKSRRSNRIFTPLFHLAVVPALTLAFAGMATATAINWSGATNTTWATGTNWSGGTAPASSLTADTAVFNLATYPNQPNAGTTSVSGVQIGSGSTGALTLSGTALSIGAAGVDMQSGAAAASLTTPVTFGAAQTWQNASANKLTGSGAITNGGFLLTVGGTGNTDLTSTLTGTGGLTKTGSGTLTLTGAKALSGALIANGGLTVFGAGGTVASVPSITVNSGATVRFSGTGNSDTIGSANKPITVNSGGTLAVTVANSMGYNAQANYANLTVNSGGTLSLSALQYFNKVTLNGGTASGTGAMQFWYAAAPEISAPVSATISTPINFNNAAHTISTASGAKLTISGLLSANSNGWTKTGLGSLVLGTTSNFAGGPVSINQGSLTLPVAQAAATYNVANGGVLIVNGAPGTSFSTTSLTLGTTGYTTLTLPNFGGNPTAATAPLKVATTFTAGGTATLRVGGTFTSAGTYPLISYPAAGYTAGSLAALKVLLPPGVLGSLQDNPANKTIDLVVDAINPLLVWNGSVPGGVWDVATTPNWNNNAIVPDGLYQDGMSLMLDDTAAGTTDVVLNSLVSPGSVTVDNTTKNYSISGPGSIIGNGSLLKSGTGLLTLATNNIYTGGTTITGGTLQLGDGITDGSITGNVANDTSLVFNTIGTQTFDGVITGNGTVTKQGAGSLTITGAQASPNTLAVTAGTLQLGNGITNGSLAGGIANNASLILNNGAAQSYGSGISGTGGLTMQGAAAFTLTAANTFSGPITASSGSLVFGTGGTIANTSGITINNGATVQFSGNTNSDTIGSANLPITVNSGGTLAVTTANSMGYNNQNNMANVTVNSGGTFALSAVQYVNKITLNGGTVSSTGGGTLQFWFAAAPEITCLADSTISSNVVFNNIGHTISTASGTTLTISGNLLVLGCTKTGTGTLLLSGTNTNSSSLISEGTLQLDGTSPAVTVASGATIRGTGTASGTLAANGTLAPGNGLGTLNTGNLTFGATGSLAAEIDSGSVTADKVAITGNLTINATTTLNVTDLGAATLPLGTQLVLATYSGTWNSVPFANLAPNARITVGANIFAIHYDDAIDALHAVTLTTVTADPFQDWIAGYSLTGPDALKSADPDHDGVPNLLEFASASDPTNPNSKPRIYPLIHTLGADQALTYTMAVRKDAIFAAAANPNEAKQTATQDLVIYTVEAGADLAVWNLKTVSEVTGTDATDVQTALGDAITTPALDPAWEWHTFRTPLGTADEPKSFIRLNVAETP